MKKQKLVIVGAGGLGREVCQLIHDINLKKEIFELLGFVDKKGTDQNLLARPLLGDDTWALRQHEELGFVLGIGASVVREKLSATYTDSELKPIELVHPTALLGHAISRGQGCMICAGSILTTDIQLGNFVNINLQCTIGHDCVLEDFVTLHPGVRLSGNVRVGRGCEIGTGAIILPGVNIGAYCRIGAGAVVTKDCAAKGTYVGVPAKKIK